MEQQQRLISGDNHIDLTYCPPDLWAEPAGEVESCSRRASKSWRTAATGSSGPRTRACGTASAPASSSTRKARWRAST